jgi:hypothetical protein
MLLGLVTRHVAAAGLLQSNPSAPPFILRPIGQKQPMEDSRRKR